LRLTWKMWPLTPEIRWRTRNLWWLTENMTNLARSILRTGVAPVRLPFPVSSLATPRTVLPSHRCEPLRRAVPLPRRSAVGWTFLSVRPLAASRGMDIPVRPPPGRFPWDGHSCPSVPWPLSVGWTFLSVRPLAAFRGMDIPVRPPPCRFPWDGHSCPSAPLPFPVGWTSLSVRPLAASRGMDIPVRPPPGRFPWDGHPCPSAPWPPSFRRSQDTAQGRTPETLPEGESDLRTVPSLPGHAGVPTRLISHHLRKRPGAGTPTPRDLP
jgi:hypothetical protein